MGEIAANAHPLLIGFIGSAGGAGILIAERQMVADEIADRLNPAPAAKCRSEQLPSEVTKLIGFAITAAESKNQSVVWQSFDRDLFGIELDRIGLAAILDDGVAANGQIASGRDKPANMIAERIDINLRWNRRRGLERRLVADILRLIAMRVEQTNHQCRLRAIERQFIAISYEHDSDSGCVARCPPPRRCRGCGLVRTSD